MPSPLLPVIRARGPMTVAAFMELALYDPLHGYYATSAQRSGAAGFGGFPPFAVECFVMHVTLAACSCVERATQSRYNPAAGPDGVPNDG